MAKCGPFHSSLSASTDRQSGTMANIGGEGDQEYVRHRIQFTLEVPAIVTEKNSAEKPASVPPAPTPAPILPTSCVLQTVHRNVSVFQLAVEDPHCIKIMQEIRHPYILRPETIVYGAGVNHTLLVKPYAGNLNEYFQIISYEKTNSLQYIIRCVQLVFSQVISGMTYLMDHGMHHGGFSLETTYYCMEDGKPVIQLANFKGWTAPKFESEKLPEDWMAIGNGLEKAIDLINENHQHKIDQRHFCEIKDLLIKLKDRKIDAQQKKRVASEHFFFWGPGERISFFTYNIPRLLQDKDFKDKVWVSLNTPAGFVWDDTSTAFFGLLKVMNDHRENILKLEKYSGDRKTHYLSFVSGCYTHEQQFQVPLYNRTVDGTFRICDPELIVNVMRVISSYKTDKQRTREELRTGRP